jgi:hypothetical protein
LRRTVSTAAGRRQLHVGRGRRSIQCSRATLPNDSATRSEPARVAVVARFVPLRLGDHQRPPVRRPGWGAAPLRHQVHVSPIARRHVDPPARRGGRERQALAIGGPRGALGAPVSHDHTVGRWPGQGAHPQATSPVRQLHVGHTRAVGRQRRPLAQLGGSQPSLAPAASRTHSLARATPAVNDRPSPPGSRPGRIGRHALRWSPTVGRQRHAPQVEPSGTIGGEDDRPSVRRPRRLAIPRRTTLVATPPRHGRATVAPYVAIDADREAPSAA